MAFDTIIRSPRLDVGGALDGPALADPVHGGEGEDDDLAGPEGPGLGVLVHHVVAVGEVLVLPFVTVHRVRDGRVSLWKDYWDQTALYSAAPAAWVEGLASADTSWLFDATSLV